VPAGAYATLMKGILQSTMSDCFTIMLRVFKYSTKQ